MSLIIQKEEKTAMPLISVIVPVYKVEKYLKRCVDSIIAQSFSDFELILVDDGSPDDSGIICDDYASKDKRITVIHKENGGLSDARNTGIDWVFENSDSGWITFIDSDDWVNKYYLEYLYNAAIQNDVSVSSCGFIRVRDEDIVDPDIQSEYKVKVNTAEIQQQQRKSYAEFNTTVAVGRLYIRQLFQDIRYPFGRYHEDEFTTYKILFTCGNIAVIDIPLYYYYFNEASIVSSDLSVKRMVDQLDALAEQISFFAEHDYRPMFEVRFWEYCTLIEKYSKQYKGKTDYTAALESHKFTVKDMIERYDDYIPENLKKYGYKDWVTGRADVKEGFRKDIASVKSEKGFLFSVLWITKNYYPYRKRLLLCDRTLY